MTWIHIICNCQRVLTFHNFLALKPIRNIVIPQTHMLSYILRIDDTVAILIEIILKNIEIFLCCIVNHS